MKKNTPHLLSVAALSLFLVACGDKQSTTSAPPAAAPMASTPAPDPAPPPPVAATEPAATDAAKAASPGTAAPADAPASTAAAPPDASPASPAAPAAVFGGTAPVSNTAMGKGVYDKACALCHAAGVAGAPKLADKTDWAPRIAQGKETLYKHAIEGYQGTKGMMPPKGGNSSLSDDEVKASVDYMASQAM